ncbi:tyrosine-type recombinase/integrase [Bacillus kwashiorkori]|uniref:tyrosine-type recombinase/integrase n=1 Tax=Bacillus kwashiorkori TaxID=1522318 RepID=UPI000781BAF9|nr:site-specific integrase [Bacillus kwashiorkori]
MSSILIQKQNDSVFEESGHLKQDVFENILANTNRSETSIKNMMYVYRNFKKTYPALEDWYKEDMKVRISNSHERNLCYRARIYIYCLALNGVKLDYDYLFSISGTDGYSTLSKQLNIDHGINELEVVGRRLGYSKFAVSSTLIWSFYRILMYTGKKHYSQITIEDIKYFKAKAIEYCHSEGRKLFWGEKYSNKNLRDRFSGSSYILHLLLYSLGIVNEEPKKEHSRVKKIDRDLKHIKHQQIADAVTRYFKQCKNFKEDSTIQNKFIHIHKFISWLESNYSEIYNLSQVNRQIVEEYMSFLKEHGSDKWGKPYSANALVGYISSLKVFFDETLAWDYKDVPQRKIMFNYDLPKRPKALPRYIPEQDLKKLMDAVKKLECPYQRNAIIILRWTGARREEIQRLEVNALDYYSDGTPKLLIPIGKTNRARWVPINKEAEIAFKELLTLRENTGNLKGLVDRKTKKITDYLFMRRNQRISITYLFQEGLETACTTANLLTDEGKAKYTSHQFRHTIGTTMANKGASLPTIMKMLGHESPEMSLTYATVFDETVKDEYEKSISNNKDIAGGEYADALKKNDLNQEEVDWIKANFHKTYLIMGHCFHHTKEPMCDFADACYFCPKYVTTKEHIPLLQQKYETELQLIDDADQRGWDRETARHKRVAERVKEILSDLGAVINA